MVEATGEEVEAEEGIEVSTHKRKPTSKANTGLRTRVILPASPVISLATTPPSALMRSLNSKKP